MKTSLERKNALISICLISLLTSISFLTTPRTPIFQKQPPKPKQSPPNPTRGPKIDLLRYQVVEAVTPPPDEILYVDEFTADVIGWTTYGDSPYLNATGDGNYIEATTNGAMIAWFGFENATLGATIGKVVLEGYTDGPYNEEVDYDIYTEQNSTWIGSLYATGAPAWVTPRWIGLTVDEAYPPVLTEEGLNSLQVLVYFYDPEEHGGPGNVIDALRLKVWYQEWPDALTQRVEAMQECKIDVLTDLIRPTDIDKLDSECFTITSSPQFHICHFGFNIRPNQTYRGRPELGPFLSDVNFRHALIHLYNQEEIIASIYGYTVTPIQSLIPPAQGGWYNPAVPTHPYDPDTAIAILEGAGYYYDVGIDNWRNATGYPVPEIRIFSPTLLDAPPSTEHVQRFVDDCNDIGLTTIIAEPTDFWEYREKVFAEADFDAYMMCLIVDRFPDHVYDMCHSSQDCAVHPWRYNAPGINDTELDALVETVRYSLDHEAKVDACYEVQSRLYNGSYSYAFAYINMYSRVNFNAFKAGLTGIVNSLGFGSDNMWTLLNIHWEPGHPNERIENGNSTVVWCLDEEPERLNPLSASTTYSWEILDRIYDPLIATDPYTHEDLPWLAESWSPEEFTGTVTLDSENRLLGLPAGATVDVVDGMKCTYVLRDDVEWQDGNLYVPIDAEFNLEFLRNNQIPRYASMWEHLVDVQVINSTAFTVYSNVTSQFLLYDLVGTAALLPPPVWARLDGRPLNEILAYEPGANTTAPAGAGPHFGDPGYCQSQLYGTGLFIYTHYHPIEMYVDMPANRYYFKSTEEIQTQKVEMFWACGDVDRDGVVDQIDEARLNASFGCVVGEPCYDPDCDFNSDGVVDGYDSARISFFWGSRREYPAEVCWPLIYVDPEKTVVGSAGKDFSVNISIAYAPYNMTWAWEFRLSWDTSLLNITEISEGLFLNESGTWATTFVNLTNQEEGWVLASCTLTEDPIEHGQPLPHGNGTLATVNFTVLNLGGGTLNLSDTILLDYNIDPYNHTTRNGEFEVLLGDINGDGIVDDLDGGIIANAYGSTPGDSNWNPEADIWGPNDEPDGYINIYDLAMWGKKYGETTDP